MDVIFVSVARPKKFLFWILLILHMADTLSTIHINLCELGRNVGGDGIGGGDGGVGESLGNPLKGSISRGPLLFIQTALPGKSTEIITKKFLLKYSI